MTIATVASLGGRRCRRAPTLVGMSVRLRLLVLVCTVALVAVLLVLVGPHSPGELRDLVARAGPAAPVALLVAWLVLVPALFSGPVLAGASGLILGTVPGAGVALLGATLGAAISFLLARGAGRDVAHRLAGARVAAVERALVRRPILGIAALRVAPGMPASGLAYAAGLTRLRLRHFTCGMALGGAPRILAYTMLGGSLTNLASPAAIAALVMLAVLTIAGGVMLWRSRRSLLAAA